MRRLFHCAKARSSIPYKVFKSEMVRRLVGQFPTHRGGLNFNQGRVQAMTKIPYEIPAGLRGLTTKSVEEARMAFESFIEAAHKATAQAEGTANALQSGTKEGAQLHRSECEGNVRSRPEACSSEKPAGNPRPSVRICEEAARRHGGASEGDRRRAATGSAFETCHPA
jgi:hypothetical protein